MIIAVFTYWKNVCVKLPQDIIHNWSNMINSMSDISSQLNWSVHRLLLYIALVFRWLPYASSGKQNQINCSTSTSSVTDWFYTKAEAYYIDLWKNYFPRLKLDCIGLCSVLRPLQHSIGYMGDAFYRSKDPTNSKRSGGPVNELKTKQSQGWSPPKVDSLAIKIRNLLLTVTCKYNW